MLVSVSLCALMASGSAYAQTVAPTNNQAVDNQAAVTQEGVTPTTGTPNTAAPVATPQTTDAQRAANTGIDDIVVTAQRRSESIQRVPVSIVAISEATLERQQIVSTEALQSLTPGLQLSKSGGFPQPFLRGIGNDRSTNAESSVATYIDGVYIAYSAATSQDLYDVERVEVLRGPQGALFGRNSTGGAINIISKKPSNTFSAKASLTGGNYSFVNGRAYVTGPIADNLAASIALSGRFQDGFNKNISTRKVDGFDDNDWAYSGRAKLLWTPGPVESELSFDYMKMFDFDNTAYRQVQPNATGFALGGITGSKPYEVAYAQQVGVQVEQYGVTLHNDVDLGFGSLVSITGYRNARAFPQQVELSGTDVIGTRADVNTISRQFSQEVQLLSNPTSPVKWLLGGLYFHELQANREYLVTARTLVAGAPRTVAQQDTQIAQHTNSYAVYGSLTVPLLVEGLSANAQLRYTWEKRSVDPFTVTNQLTTPYTVTNFTGKSADFNALTYRFGLDYQVTSNLLLYIQRSRGYKAGVFNLPSASTDLGPVNPEVLTSTEGGAKIDVIKNILRVNLSAFHYDVKDLQVSIISPGTGLTVIRNAASARMNGGEVEIVARPVDRLQVSAGLAFLDAKYGTFVNFPLLTPRPAPGFGNVATPTDLSGRRAMRSPKFTSNIDATYTLPVATGSLALNTVWYHNSGFNFTPAGAPQSAFDTVNASATYKSDKGGWSVGIWGRNVLDKRYLNQMQISGLGTNVNYAPPATYGGTFSVEF